MTKEQLTEAKRVDEEMDRLAESMSLLMEDCWKNYPIILQAGKKAVVVPKAIRQAVLDLVSGQYARDFHDLVEEFEAI